MILSIGGQEFEDNRVPIIGIPTPLPQEIKESKLLVVVGGGVKLIN